MLGNIALGSAASLDDFLNACARVAKGAKDLEPQGMRHGLNAVRSLGNVLLAVDQIMLHSVFTLLAGYSVPEARGI